MATKFDYFDTFIAQAEVCLEEANLLLEVAETFTDGMDLAEMTARAHVIENKGDQLNHAIYNNIATDFITPIERDDLLSISGSLDDLTDNIEEVILSLYMFDIHEMRPRGKRFAEIIQEACGALNSALHEFKNYKKPKELHTYIIKINDCEEAGDKLYFDAMHRLYVEEKNEPMEVLVWSRLFNLFEKCCDACEHVADVLATAVLKNS